MKNTNSVMFLPLMFVVLALQINTQIKELVRENFVYSVSLSSPQVKIIKLAYQNQLLQFEKYK